MNRIIGWLRGIACPFCGDGGCPGGYRTGK
jgi:hypothetical protein